MNLPSKVQEIGNAAEAQATAQQMKGAPGEAPTPVAQPTPALTPAPAAAPIDTENWETRFKNLRAQRDETIEQQGQQIGSLQQMMETSQKQNAELLARLDKMTATPAPSVEDTREAAYQEWLKKLDPEFVSEYEDGWLRGQYAMQIAGRPEPPAADTGMEKRMKAVEERSQANETVQVSTAWTRYLEELDAAFPGGEWEQITNSTADDWKSFCDEKTSPLSDAKTFGQELSDAHKAANSASLIWVLTQYKTRGSKPQPNPLDVLITPEGSAGGDALTEINAQTEVFSDDQINEFYAQQSRDVGKSNPMYTKEQALAIEQRIIAYKSR